MVAEYQLRPVTLDDVETYVRCQVECLAQTYATIMPPAFAQEHRRTIAERIASTGRDWAANHGAGDGRGAQAWLAVDLDDDAVGVARSGPGPQQWETDMSAPPTPVDFQLHHVYTLQRTHGTGLGQSLLDLALEDRDAYLWILHGNARAERFYRRNGFSPDGAEMSCGSTWFHRSMFRMVRRVASI